MSVQLWRIKLGVTLTNVDEELKYNREQINILTENNNSLELRVKTLDDKVKAKDDEIKNIKNKYDNVIENNSKKQNYDFEL